MAAAPAAAAAGAAAAAAAAAINHRRKQESDSQTCFLKPTRNSKTPPNFVTKMTQNQSQ